MLKGVNRQVVEVSHPESAYFEKVLFFVKPEASRISESRLKDKADAMIKEAANPPAEKASSAAKSRMKQFLKLTAAAVGGAAVSAILALIF